MMPKLPRLLTTGMLLMLCSTACEREQAGSRDVVQPVTPAATVAPAALLFMEDGY